MTFRQSVVAARMQMAVLGSKNAECITLLPPLQNKCENYFVNFFPQSGWFCTMAREEAIGDVLKFNVTITLLIT